MQTAFAYFVLNWNLYTMITIGLGTTIMLFIVWFIFAYGCYATSCDSYKEAIHVPNYPISMEDTKGEAHKLILYLMHIDEKRNGGKEESKEFEYYRKKVYSPEVCSNNEEILCELIRWAEKLGCEVVVRQISDEDIEADKNKGDAFWEYLGQVDEKYTEKWLKEFKKKSKE